MHQLNSITQSANPRRLLNAGGINRILNRWRLPHRDRFITALEQQRQRIYLFDLWQQVFDEAPPRMPYADLAGRFVERIDTWRFPIDDDAVRYMLGENDDIMAMPIPYLSYGIPWESEYIDDLQWWAQPIAAILQPVMCDLDDDYRETVYNWLHGAGLNGPAYTFIERGSGQEILLQEALACQPSPLNGLAVVVDCMRKCDDNCFVDDPPLMAGRSEYLGVFSQYFWTELNIEMLYVQYMQVEAKIDRLRDYIAWSRRAGTEAHVVDLLTRLVDEPWHIEECAGVYKQVVFDDR